MSDWPKCNPERHIYNVNHHDCQECLVCCSEDAPCRCCLQAEVADLRAQVQRVRELHRVVIDFAVNGEEVEHCEECGYVGVDGEECPTVQALDGAQ